MARSASYLERGAEILSIGSCAASGIDEERAGAEKKAKPASSRKLA